MPQEVHKDLKGCEKIPEGWSIKDVFIQTQNKRCVPALYNLYFLNVLQRFVIHLDESKRSNKNIIGYLNEKSPEKNLTERLHAFIQG